MDMYRVYAKINESGSIVETNSSAFLSDTTGWVQIDEGMGDQYHHAQGNYFQKPKYDERGIPRYAYVPDGDPKWRERTPEEMDADYVPPQPVKTVDELAAENELLRAQVQSLADRGEFIEDCIAEMAMQVYQ
ncbi:hypothetical protein [Ruthenibacterium lactatiformans]|uniref:hypothetical protein n=1 Tax=Ruthenibacterium lactatiformans TaxID=1550024 RepID=UPI003AB9552E